MRFLQTGVCVVAMFALAGCGVFGSKRVDYCTGAEQAASLELPPDLTVPGSEDRYKIPQGDTVSVATYSDYSKTPAAAPELKTLAAGNKVLVMKEPFDKSWRKVGLAIEHAGLPVDDKDRSKGIYYLRSTKADGKKSAARDDAGHERRYQILVKDGGETCAVTTSDQDGSEDDESKKLLLTIQTHLNQ